MGKKETIDRYLLKNIFLIVGIIVAVMITIQYYFAYELVLELTKKRFEHLAKQATVIVKESDSRAEETIAILGEIPTIKNIDTLQKERELLKIFITPIKRDNTIYAIYIGYKNGNYFEVVNNKHSPAVAKMFNAPPKTDWIVVKINRVDGVAHRTSHFYDKDLNFISKLEEITKYDPRKRPWYNIALGKNRVVSTEPYLYYRLKKMGITYSLDVKDGTVIAMDMTLEGLSGFLKDLKAKSGIEIFMVGKDKTIASSEGIEKKVDKELLEASKDESQNIISYHKDGEDYLAMVINGKPPVWLAFKAKRSEMMKPYLDIIHTEIMITIILILLIIPLVRHIAQRFLKPINALLEENQKIKNREFNRVKKINCNILELNQLSTSMVDMAKSIKEYEKKQEMLLEGFIHLIAETIDAKSHYTGEHCKRVPIIAKMLIKEVDKADYGELKDFKIQHEDTLKALEWSAWLHDCGKLVVPEHVVDKATKLETVYNRIHEIRTRFEVLLRDARIKYLENLLIGEDSKRAKDEFDKEKAKLQSDFEFIAKINVGEVPLKEDDYKRLESIASIKWERNFSNRIGISWGERELLGNLTKEEKFPVEENLLLDGNIYRVPRDRKDFEIFKRESVTMKVPDLLYNKGELYNLSIRQGTLTEEEKFKINEHAIHTLRMLKELPWADHLKNVVDDASNHHEYLDGSGYPRSLTKDDLSIPARIMTIADIFEALTSSDRPYKKPKTLSQTLNIMVDMAKNYKIDSELFILMMEKDIHLKFAKMYLSPEQIDIDKVDKDKMIEDVREAVKEFI
jgi:HD-GYP domain-containing protein (c-di-GMP phosphodiesterase class II)